MGDVKFPLKRGHECSQPLLNKNGYASFLPLCRPCRKVRADLEAASRFDSPDLVPGAAASAAARSPSVMRKLAERERERRAKKLLKLKVTRGRRVHIFNTRLGREIQLILNACRKELLDDNEQGAELSLLCQVCDDM